MCEKERKRKETRKGKALRKGKKKRERKKQSARNLERERERSEEKKSNLNSKLYNVEGKRVVIVGASSGIGAELARQYSAKKNK